MEKNVWYTVTKDSDDGTLQVGDTIKLHDDGHVICLGLYEWINEEDVEESLKGAEFEINNELLELRMKNIIKELERLKKLASGGYDDMAR